MSLTLTFEIKLASNYHIGAGYSFGSGIDSALLRDADGVPVIRGSILAGLLRDGLYRLIKLPLMEAHRACERSGLAKSEYTPTYCDLIPRNQEFNGLGSQEEEKLCPICRLFGTPSMPKRWEISSARPRDLRQPLEAGKWRAGMTGAQKVQRVRVDPKTRRSEPGKLFSQEDGDARLIFCFTATCSRNDDAALDDAALLVAAARNVRQLGRSRRRGLGECLINLIEVAGVDHKLNEKDWQDWFLDRFGSSWLEGKPALISIRSTNPFVDHVQISNNAHLRFRVIMRLDEPLILAERAVAGNSFDTRQFIPGTVFLGALAKAAAERCDLNEPQNYKDFVALFLRGEVAFPSLYPALYFNDNLYSPIAAPMGMLTCKAIPIDETSSGHGVSSFPQDGSQAECPDPECQSRLESISGFAVLKNGAPYIYNPSRSTELHIRIDPERNRVSAGDLYSYTVLNAGQYFIGEMLCTDASAWNQLLNMTGLKEKSPFLLRMGKAMRRGYGQVTGWVEPCDGNTSVWIQIPLKQRISDPLQPLTLTLLTDTIIADDLGRFSMGFDSDWTESELGLGPVKIMDTYSRIRQVDGFNNQMGLPRWRDYALIAGSAVSLRFLEPPPDWADRMDHLERTGIGLRRNEGYGKLAFNHPVYELCKNISGSNTPLDPCMCLAEEPEDNALIDENRFNQRWDHKLDEYTTLLCEACQDPRFSALARWLYGNANLSLSKLQDRLRVFGKPSPDLVTALKGQEEYGDRKMDPFFSEEGQNGIDVIIKAINYLEKEDKMHHTMAIRRLAGRIEAAAKGEACKKRERSA
jgi:CRISPR-associated protein Csx10